VTVKDELLTAAPTDEDRCKDVQRAIDSYIDSRMQDIAGDVAREAADDLKAKLATMGYYNASVEVTNVEPLYLDFRVAVIVDRHKLVLTHRV